MKKKLKKLANRIMVRVFGYIPYPKEYEYKIVEREVSPLSFTIWNLNQVNNF